MLGVAEGPVVLFCRKEGQHIGSGGGTCSPDMW